MMMLLSFYAVLPICYSDRYIRAHHELSQKENKEIVLIIDEIEGLKNKEILNTFMHTIRSIYHRKEAVKLRSVILTGVSNITGIIQDNASPFNIADQLDLPYFTMEEVLDLLNQHEKQTGQIFDKQVKEEIYNNTLGQPGLVCALARDLVEKKSPDGQKVEMGNFYKTVDDFTRVYIDKNISNVLNKAEQYPEIILEILFGNGVAYDTSDQRISYLRVNGVIDDCEGMCCIKTPLYKKRIYNAFKPKINGEKNYFKEQTETYKKYLNSEGYLDINRLIERYIQYIKNRGNIIFSNGKDSEGVYHYNINAFLTTYAQLAGAHLLVETPTGGGRVDILIIQREKKDVLEIKLYDIDLYDKSIRQVYEYLKRADIQEGYLLFFSKVHENEEYKLEEIEEKILHTWIIPVRSETPSRIV